MDNYRSNIVIILCQCLSFCLVFQFLFLSLDFFESLGINKQIYWHIIPIILSLDMIRRRSARLALILFILNFIASTQSILIIHNLCEIILGHFRGIYKNIDTTPLFILLGLFSCSTYILINITIFIYYLKNEFIDGKNKITENKLIFTKNKANKINDISTISINSSDDEN